MLKVAGQDARGRRPTTSTPTDGQIFVVGRARRGDRASDEVASQVYRHTFGPEACDVEPGLEATRYFRIGNVYHQPETQGRFSTYPTWPNGAAAGIVEVDPGDGLRQGAALLRRCTTRARS